MPLFANLRAYAELMRIANVFTAVSNVWMGMILATGGLPGWTAVGITATSCLLYLAGMVLNDVFDHKIDIVERPARPIPSGRVSLRTASWLGWGLLAGGLMAGWATALLGPNLAPGFITLLLAGAVVAYDAGLKKTIMGPVAMGICRLVNVLLGMSLAAKEFGFGHYYWSDVSPVPALGIGVYVIGVSWFARSEAGESRRWLLVVSSVGAMAGLAFIAAIPWLEMSDAPPLQMELFGWYLLWGVIAATILRRMVVAILQPRPKFVQRAVGHALLSLILIDAAIVAGYGGPYWACAILALLAPATILSQWFKVT